MIKDFEFYHGAALSRMVHCSSENVCIRPYPTSCNSSYVINDDFGVYIKYSTKRLSPWRFSFSDEHQNEIADMNQRLSAVYVLLVCHTDGVVALSFDEFRALLDERHEAVEWVSASRGRGQMYLLKGSDGTLPFKIGRNEFPAKMFQETNSAPQTRAGRASL